MLAPPIDVKKRVSPPMTTFTFNGRVAVITGAASGIGAALAHNLAARGAKLALADIDEAGLHALTSTLPTCAAPGVRTLDVADSAACADFAAHVEDTYGGAHLLINNAGVALHGEFEQLSEADFDWLIDINFQGVVRMTRAFLPQLRRADSAHIVNISSLFGLIAPAGQTAYAASKFAVRGFSDALRHELQGSTIGVTTVHPGGVRTNIARSALKRAANIDDRDSKLARAERMLSMPPEKAAATIVRAIERRKLRLLIGADAHVATLIERIAPAHYWALLGARRLKKSPAAATRSRESHR
jgi:short-subunit dehydrogenase